MIPRNHDYRTHHHDWLRACKLAQDGAKTDEDWTYWEHQINTLNNIEKAIHEKESPFSHKMSVDEVEVLLSVARPLFSTFTYLEIDFVVVKHNDPWMECEYVNYKGEFCRKYFSFEMMKSLE